MSYVVAISAFFVVAAFAAFIKFDCGNAAELQAKASEARNARQAKFAAASKTFTFVSSTTLLLPTSKH